MSEELEEIKNSDLPQRREDTTVVAREKQEENDRTDATNPSEEERIKARSFFYPLSIRGPSDDFPNRIIFRAVRVEGVNIAAAVKAGIGKLVELLPEGVSEAEAESTATATGVPLRTAGNAPPAEDEAPVVDQAARIGASVGDYLKKTFVGSSYENPGSGQVVGSVTLPLPRDLRYSDIMGYETANLGVVGAALEGAIRGRNPFSGISLTNGGLAQATSAIGAQILARIGGNVAAGAVGGALAGAPGAFLGALAAGDVGEGLEAGVRSATRIVAAPNSKTIFQNVGIRNFNFAFKMIAQSEDEGKQIREILKFFREEMYPEVIPLGNTGVPLGYKFPSEFEIEIKNKFGQNPAFKIARCYLRDVQTAFNSTAMGMYSDGNFVEVDIVLAFVEIEALHRGKISKEGY